MESKLRSARTTLAAAEQRQATAKKTLDAIPAGTESAAAISARYNKQIADAEVTAATAHVRVLVEELSRVRVQQVFRRLGQASTAQSSWMDTARRLKHVTKKLIATRASKKEKQRVCEAMSKWAAEKTLEDAKKDAERSLCGATARTQQVLIQILKKVSDTITLLLQDEAQSRPKKLSLRDLGTAMENTPQAASLALQYYKTLETLCGTYAAATNAHLDLVFAWMLQKVDDF